MTRRFDALTLDNLSDLAEPCRNCVAWELDPVAAGRVRTAGDPGLEKEAWLSRTLLEWGSCGRIAYVDGEPVGHVVYAPPAMVPRSVTFPTSPPAGDAVLLMNASVQPALAGTGLGRTLVQQAAKDVLRRGIRALEAFGDARGESGSCVLPADYLRSVGFKTVRAHHRWPRLRLDLRSALTWREDVEEAIDRLLGQLSPSAANRPRLPVAQACARSCSRRKPVSASLS